VASGRYAALTGAHRLRNATTGAVLVDQLRVANTHWSRLKGLLGSRALRSDEGLCIIPCRQVHTVGMRYPVDLVFLDHANKIVHTERGFAPGRFSRRVVAAASVVELAAGSIERLGMAPGTRVVVEPPLNGAERSRSGKVGTILCNFGLAALYGFFIAAHVSRAFDPDQRLLVLPLVVQETIIVVLFLARRPSRMTSTRTLDWAVGVAGTYLPLLLRPRGAPGSLAPVGQIIQLVGVSAATVALLFLGRSFGIVPANRGVKTVGAYRAVRHPIYGGYLLTYVGYVLSYPTPVSALIVVTTLVLQVTRAGMEERLLAEDPLYREYLRRTPWRFIPYVY